jgi:hypothetical protein
MTRVCGAAGAAIADACHDSDAAEIRRNLTNLAISGAAGNPPNLKNFVICGAAANRRIPNNRAICGASAAVTLPGGHDCAGGGDLRDGNDHHRRMKCNTCVQKVRLCGIVSEAYPLLRAF